MIWPLRLLGRYPSITYLGQRQCPAQWRLRKIQHTYSVMTRTATGAVDLYSIQLQRGFESLKGTLSARCQKARVISLRGRTRFCVRGYASHEYLKESSIGRISDHDYNTREGLYGNLPTTALRGGYYYYYMRGRER